MHFKQGLGLGNRTLLHSGLQVISYQYSFMVAKVVVLTVVVRKATDSNTLGCGQTHLPAQKAWV